MTKTNIAKDNARRTILFFILAAPYFRFFVMILYDMYYFNFWDAKFVDFCSREWSVHSKNNGEG